MKLNKKNRGITLVALIVTIIILIILAGISINMIMGNNGLFSKAIEAKQESQKQTATETMNLKITNIQISSYAENEELPSLQFLADKLCEDNDIEYVLTSSKEHASLKKIDVTNISSIFTKLKDYPYEFEINSSLQLASIDGVKVATVPDNDDTIVSMTKAELKSLIASEVSSQLGSQVDITTEEGSITLSDAENWTVSFNKVIKTGNQCTIMFAGTYKNNFNNTSTQIGTLPYTPKYMITDSGAVSTVDIHQIKNMLYVFLGSNGQINVADWGATGGKTIVINTTYICTE